MRIPHLSDSELGLRADKEKVEPLLIECLRCGHQRLFTPSLRRHQEAGECPRCAYLGWAEASDLTEGTRRLFRDRPLERGVKLRTG